MRTEVFTTNSITVGASHLCSPPLEIGVLRQEAGGRRQKERGRRKGEEGKRKKEGARRRKEPEEVFLQI
ncbi:hypothetical protein [Microcoleus sp. AT13-A5]|uniref:hypothetical protein n=1 Tax=Microcoleus sp. AT13-A5 TaxID=2818590 RepID=UPI002FD4207F